MVCDQDRSFKYNIKRGQTTGSASSLFMTVSENPHKTFQDQFSNHSGGFEINSVYSSITLRRVRHRENAN